MIAVLLSSPIAFLILGLLVGYLYGYDRGDSDGRYDVTSRWADADRRRQEEQRNKPRR